MSYSEEIANFIRDNTEQYCLIKGAFGSSKSYLISDVVDISPKIHIVVADTKEEAEYLTSDLYCLVGEERVFYFPSSHSKISKTSSIKEASNRVLRSITLNAINNFSSESIVVVTYPESLKEPILKQEEFKKSIISIKRGESISFDTIKEKLINEGFSRVDYVSSPGEFAIRGSIFDIFSYSDDKPYRLDFFGDEPQTIRQFDINTQRSVKEVDSIDIFPDIYDTSKINSLGGTIFLDYVENNSCVVWSDTFEDLSLFYSDKKLISLNSKILKKFSDSSYREIVQHISPQPSFNKNFALLADDIRRRESENYKVYICSTSEEQIERLKTIFRESSHISKDGIPNFTWQNISIHSGFIDSDKKICLYTDHQIFERFHRVKIKREIHRSERVTLEELNSYHIGDYVVHIDHGVGVFGGLAKTNVNGKTQEVIKIMYKDGDVIFVSVHGLYKIAKYKSKDGIPPKIYKLGSGVWNKLKNNTKAKIKDIAKDLISLYSKRKQTKGFAFSADNYMQQELEASFMYEDTPDQLKATKDVKRDMEAPNPMDRLVCGDVGFGKTEVAIRAAFKAVSDSKQVCLLVPTTILALQHYQTFTERLKKFPVNIDYISRLRSPKEIKEVQQKIKEGKVDIIIGTHRVLNKQFEFKDLGLLIIDEEQKFGVAAKERLRQLKVEVDTLTLTATPIPRTLQFSLLGARDLSIINTPPPNRLPVHTEIIDFDEDVIREIIDNEIKRGGQIFFVHNRVEDILSVEQMINRIYPKAKCVVGHGQMEPKLLENKILEFIRGDYDILISTTIIENGIDIPNANTIIINQAYMFGLSDLHQLRGRVGRSNTKAYCYLIVPPTTLLTDDAKRRINAIEAFSELGSGFNIAMQDLDIRGAGNLLGGEQSGFIADMGFETYQRILNEAFVEINTEMGISSESQPQFSDIDYVADTVIDTDLELYIPEEYVEQTTERVKLYKQLETLTKESDIEEFILSLKDRFGEVPEQVYGLVNVVKLRTLAKKLGFEKVVIKNKILLLYFVSQYNSGYYKSDTFLGIIDWMKDRRDCNWREENGKSWIRMPMVTTIEQSYKIVKDIYDSIEGRK